MPKNRRANNIWYYLRSRRMVTDLSERLNLTRDQAIVLITIYMGDFRGRPFDVTCLAEETSIARPNVIRHLKTLVDRGMVRQETEGKRVLNLIPEQPSLIVLQWMDELETTVEAMSRHRRLSTTTVHNGQ